MFSMTSRKRSHDRSKGLPAESGRHVSKTGEVNMGEQDGGVDADIGSDK